MASSSSISKLLHLRKLSRALKLPKFPPPLASSSSTSIANSLVNSSTHLHEVLRPPLLPSSRNFCSRHLNLEDQGPATIDYRSVLQEDEFHKLADYTIHDLLEKLEEFSNSVDIDDFDIDYGSQVLTLKLGTLGTYVLNKQTPNRQIWLSSPVSGPSRYDWDRAAQAWVYRRTKENLVKVLENELEHLCGQHIDLS